MSLKSNKHLYLVPKDVSVLEGPITRLGLWYRFSPMSKKQFAFFLLSKLLLLGMVFYLIYEL